MSIFKHSNIRLSKHLFKNQLLWASFIRDSCYLKDRGSNCEWEGPDLLHSQSLSRFTWTLTWLMVEDRKVFSILMYHIGMLSLLPGIPSKIYLPNIISYMWKRNKDTRKLGYRKTVRLVHKNVKYVLIIWPRIVPPG